MKVKREKTIMEDMGQGNGGVAGCKIVENDGLW